MQNCVFGDIWFTIEIVLVRWWYFPHCFSLYNVYCLLFLSIFLYC